MNSTKLSFRLALGILLWTSLNPGVARAIPAPSDLPLDRLLKASPAALPILRFYRSKSMNERDMPYDHVSLFWMQSGTETNFYIEPNTADLRKPSCAVSIYHATHNPSIPLTGKFFLPEGLEVEINDVFEEYTYPSARAVTVHWTDSPAVPALLQQSNVPAKVLLFPLTCVSGSRDYSRLPTVGDLQDALGNAVIEIFP